jgi:tetratricopeptide (TPR) repeat protein
MNKISDVVKAYDQKNYQSAIELAKPFLNAADALVAREAKNVTALSEFQLKNFPESLRLFQEMAEGSSDFAVWFNVTTSAVMLGDFTLGERAFNIAIELRMDEGVCDKTPIPMLRFYYANALKDKGQFLKAMEQINELRSIYEQLKISDDTFVFMRGVPMLGHTMDLAMTIFKELGASFDAKTWLEKFSAKLDDDGKETLRAYTGQLES